LIAAGGVPEVVNNHIVGKDDLILITGSNGFIGSKVVETLLDQGHKNLRCFVRPSSNAGRLEGIIKSASSARIDVVKGNLLSPDDCRSASRGAAVIIHVAAGIEKTFAGCFMNSVVTTRNLLESCRQNDSFKRFVNVSSFAVYSNMGLRRRAVLDETCKIEDRFMERFDAYCYGKVKQDEIVREYGGRHSIPYVIVRPGIVYGPRARAALHSRVGINPFGLFFHLGGSNRLPLAYIDNCAEAIVMAAVKKGGDGEAFNIIDDDLPTSRKFLRLYKKNVRRFRTIFIPYRLYYLFCYVWEKYSKWSGGQLPLAFNRRKCAAEYKGNTYPNKKLKDVFGWAPRVSTKEGITRHCAYFKGLETPNA
jgi:nucleoside-diphosphate-sugar epimerase